MDSILLTKVSQIVPPKKDVIACTDQQHINDAFQLLIDNKILSLPVLNTKTQEYDAFIDLIDIVCHAADIILESEIKEGFDKTIAKIEFGRYTVGQLAGYSQRNPFRSITPDATLQEAIEAFVQYGVHRVAVMNNKKLESILSQSQIIKAVTPYITRCSFADKTVGELHLGYRPVVSIPITAPASEAFKKMQKARVSGLAVINSRGEKLVGAISTSDLKAIGYNGNLIDRLLLPIHEYWRKGIAETSKSSSPRIHLPLYIVTPNSTIREVFQLFDKTGVHRLFLVDNESHKQLLGVITLLDLISLLHKHHVTQSASK